MNLEILEKYAKDGKLRKSEDKELVQYNYTRSKLVKPKINLQVDNI